MKIIRIILFPLCAAGACFALFSAAAASPTYAVRLPYTKGQSFIVTQGYDSPPTHIKKDAYALDFTQNGCDAYGRAAIAAAAGTVMFVGEEGYNGGYGTEVIVDHGNNLVSRYAHMIAGSAGLSVGASVRRGETVGLVGDTGLVAGAACADHPGTHLHFAMDTVNGDGTFSAYNPEPISGYAGIAEGKWYLSDNGDDDGAEGAVASGNVLGASVAASATIIVPASTTLPATMNTAPPAPPTMITLAGVPAPAPPAPAADVPQDPAAEPSSTPVPTPSSTPTSTATSTLPDDAATTTIAAATSTEPSSTTVTSTIVTSTAAAAATGTLFAQLDDSANSAASWYGDNWFTLGNGFAGTLGALTLKGRVSAEGYFATQVWLQEFKDKNYGTMVAQFPIANASFTTQMATAMFDGLSIPLKPYFYYRLYTLQNYQNRSAILAGTASTTAGIAMRNEFVYGTGRVESTSTFFPYLVMAGEFTTSTITPPPITPPSNITEHFDPLGMQIGVVWSTSTDPDWPENPLHYQMNWSTSTALDDLGWTTPAPIPVALGNSYLIGIRALDDHGAISAPATTTWDFPAGFMPYRLSPPLSYAYQYFTVSATSTLSSVRLYTANFNTGARNWGNPLCYLQVFDEYASSSLGATPPGGPAGVSGFDCRESPAFSFSSWPLVLHPDHTYHWVLTASTGNPSTGASVQLYGTATDTAGGPFSDPSLANARFTLIADDGSTIFSN